jgi:Copper type II ascorbate-dependent monooxygenase, C-terminal domain
VPPHSQIFVSYHLLNTSLDPLAVDLSAALRLLREPDVATRVTAGGGLLSVLAIPPLARSRFSSDCAFAEPPTFKGYFVLPHYHRFGTGMRLELVGGTRNGEVVWESAGSIGEALGSKIAPAVDFSGATGFRFSCAYDNTTSETLHSGASGKDEMCSFYVHTDSPHPFYGMTTPATPQLVDQGTNDVGERVFSVDGCALLVR